MRDLTELEVNEPTANRYLQEREQIDLNRIISKAGSAIVTVTVFLFAIFLIINFSMGSYFFCLILPIGFIMMTAGLHNECEGDCKVAAKYRFDPCGGVRHVYYARLFYTVDYGK